MNKEKKELFTTNAAELTADQGDVFLITHNIYKMFQDHLFMTSNPK
jgi:hypothetical protein